MILYISKRFETDIGSTIHLNILKEIYGEDQVYIVDLRMGKAKSADNYVAFGKYANKASRLLQILQGNIMYISNQTINQICRIVEDKNIELVFIEDSVFGNLAKKIKKHYPKIPIIAFYHDIGADLYRQKRLSSKSILTKLECAITIKEERVQQRYNDINIVFSKRDVELYRKYYSSLPDAVIPLSAYIPEHSTEYTNSQNVSDNVKQLLFVGTRYWPNLVGIRWFYNNVLPGLEDNVVLNVVGRGTELLRDEFNDPRVIVHGTVDDVFDYYRMADIFIIPLFNGGGMKTKTVEAISYGKCIVGTSEGLVGFWDETNESLRNNGIYLCDHATEWIDTINNLLSSEICKFNDDVFGLFCDKFSYKSTKNAFIDIINEVNE